MPRKVKACEFDPSLLSSGFGSFAMACVSVERIYDCAIVLVEQPNSEHRTRILSTIPKEQAAQRALIFGLEVVFDT